MKVSFSKGLKAQVKAVGSGSPKGSGGMVLGRDQVLPMCAPWTSSHLAVPTSSAGHSHSQEGETESSGNTPLLSLFEHD